VGVIAVVAVPAAIAATVMQGSGSSSHKQAAHHPRLLPDGLSPLRIKGTGFVSRERVRLKLTGQTETVVVVKADRRGRFGASFHGVGSCDSVTVTATGSKGSRTSFNLSSLLC